MRSIKTALALVSLFVLAGCGGGGGSTSSTTGGNQSAPPPISPTFPTSNAGPGVETGATASSGSGATGTTTSGSNASTPVAVATLDLEPTVATVEANRRLSFTVVAKDATGNPVTVPVDNWKWTSSNPAVAVLTSTADHATVSGVAAGTTTVSVLEGKSGVTAQVTLTVTAVGANSGSAPGGSGLGGGTTGTGGTTGSAGSTLIYANDFVKGVGSEWSKTTISTTPGTAQYPATKFLGQFANDTATLTLNNLSAHTSLTLEFDFFCILTWDGNDADPNVGPSLFSVNVEGGPTLLHSSFANVTQILRNGFPASIFQSFPDAYPGGTHLYQTGAAEVGTLGYKFIGFPSDSIYHLKYTFPHTGSSVKIDFSGSVAAHALATGPDDFWGLKNVQVTTNP